MTLNYNFNINNNLIVERSNNTSVRYVSLFWKHERPWINRKVRSENLGLDRSLFVCAKSHISVADTTT
jgi:hypothetical protein